MKTLKKFWIYFLIFLLVFLLVTGLTNIAMRDNYKNTKYEIVNAFPMITVTECKASYSDGYVKGSITNNTGEHIPIKYLQVDIYDENNVYLGSEFKELKYFNVNETIKFEINYKYNNVNRLVIGVTDEIIQDKEKKENYVSNIKVEPVITEETIKIAVPISAVLMLNTALGVLETL